MVAAGKLYQLIVFYAIRLVDFTIGGVKALHAKPLLGIKEEIVDFFQNSLRRHIVHVVFVWRKAGPVARRNVGFSDGQLFCVGRAIYNKAGIAFPGLFSQAHHPHGILMNDLRLGFFGNRRGAYGNFHIPRAVDLHLAVPRSIKAFGFGAFKHIAAASYATIPHTVGLKVRLATQDDESGFPVAGIEVKGFTIGQFNDAEFELFE